MHRRLVLSLLAGAAFAAPARFAWAAAPTAADQALIDQVQTYLNGLTALTANFLQVAADGSTRTGKAWLQRPGKMRFQYDPPDKQLLVAGFGLLVYHDPDLAQTTNIPLSSTPLGILLANNVVLSGDVTVTNIDREPGEVHITLIRTGKPQEGSLTLVFGTNPLELRQWVVMDAQQRQTRVSLYDVAPGGPFPDSLFTYQAPSPTTGGG
ncbi:MAG: outer membrane lipoprotein carrier protein LolA [Acidocella sp.]|nr:outer membrane lipoprotein carrier protein LolA [Acidocella sp.]